MRKGGYLTILKKMRYSHLYIPHSLGYLMVYSLFPSDVAIARYRARR